MNDWIQLIILGLVQGLTEFLPVSSSGHLVVFQGAFERFLASEQTGAQKLFVDVMLHVGTAVAIAAYYRRDILRGVAGFVRDPGPESPTYRRGALIRIGLMTVVATIPAAVVGLSLKDAFEQIFDTPLVASACFLVTAALLVITSRLQRGREGSKGPLEMTWLDAVLIGLAQCFAILPGISRSGMTIVTGLLLGLRGGWAVGFSLLMAVPAILGAAASELKDLDPASIPSALIGPTAVGSLVSAVVGYLAIVWLVRIVRQGKLWYFSVYLVALATVALIVFSLAETGGGADGDGAGPAGPGDGAGTGSAVTGELDPAPRNGDGMPSLDRPPGDTPAGAPD